MAHCNKYIDHTENVKKMKKKRFFWLFPKDYAQLIKINNNNI